MVGGGGPRPLFRVAILTNGAERARHILSLARACAHNPGRRLCYAATQDEFLTIELDKAAEDAVSEWIDNNARPVPTEGPWFLAACESMCGLSVDADEGVNHDDYERAESDCLSAIAKASGIEADAGRKAA